MFQGLYGVHERIVCFFHFLKESVFMITIFIQVNITQDSLNSFLKVAEKLKIKGLCERGTLIPEGPPFHNTITIPLQKVKDTSAIGCLSSRVANVWFREALYDYITSTDFRLFCWVAIRASYTFLFRNPVVGYSRLEDTGANTYL